MKKKMKFSTMEMDINYNPIYIHINEGLVKNKTNKKRYITLEWRNSEKDYFHLNDSKIMWKLEQEKRLYCGKYIMREVKGKYVLQILENETLNLANLFEFSDKLLMLSIVVPLYNVENYIIDLLKSFPKDNDNYEVIFVNDCSTDNTLGKLIDEIDILNYKIVNNEKNVGLGETRNIGLENCSSDYVFFLDSDDWLNNGSIEYFLKLIIDEKYTDIFIFNDKKCENYFEKKFRVNEQKYYRGNNLNFLVYRHMSSCVKLYRRELFDNIKFKKGIMFEDVYLLVDIFKEKDINIINTQVQVYNYRQRDGSIINSPFTDNTTREYEKLLYYIFESIDYEYAKFMYYRLCKHITDRNGYLPTKIIEINEIYKINNCLLYEVYVSENINGKNKANLIKHYYESHEEINKIIAKLNQ